MLILTRRIGEMVVVGEDSSISFTILGIHGNQIRVGINAPKDIPVHREEIAQRIKNERKEDSIEFKPRYDEVYFEGIKLLDEG